MMKAPHSSVFLHKERRQAIYTTVYTEKLCYAILNEVCILGDLEDEEFQIEHVLKFASDVRNSNVLG